MHPQVKPSPATTLESVSPSLANAGFEFQFRDGVSLAPVLVERYRPPCFRASRLWESNATDRIVAVERKIRGWFSDSSQVVGRSFLILGCGSPYSLEGEANPGYWEPWLARLLDHMGAEVTGIDRYAYEEDERFTYIRRDLVKQDSLNDLPRHSFDYAQVSYLFGSPSLIFSQGISQEGRVCMRERIRSQLPTLLKKDGVVLQFDEGIDD